MVMVRAGGTEPATHTQMGVMAAEAVLGSPHGGIKIKEEGGAK